MRAMLERELRVDQADVSRCVQARHACSSIAVNVTSRLRLA